MSDIAIVWDPQNFRGDLSVAAGDLLTGPSIRQAMLISLFTDARAPDDWEPQNKNDRRGSWLDTFYDRPVGSLLWTYARAKKAGNTNLPLTLQGVCQDALQWMLDDGVAASIVVTARWLTADAIGIQINITEPSGSPTFFDFSFAWKGL